MAEFTSASAQAVTSGSNVLFTSTAVSGTKCIQHREGSGLVTLRGITSGQCKARFLITFGGNITIPTGGTVGEISSAIAINGEPLSSSLMIATVAAVGDFYNISSSVYIDVPSGCCQSISVQNTSDQTITVQNANLIVTRVA